MTFVSYCWDMHPSSPPKPQKDKLRGNSSTFGDPTLMVFMYIWRR